MSEEARVFQQFFGRRVKAAREAKGLSQMQLAQRIGVGGTATISQWENGRQAPHLHMFKTLAQELEKPMEYFCMSEEEASRMLTYL